MDGRGYKGISGETEKDRLNELNKLGFNFSSFIFNREREEQDGELSILFHKVPVLIFL